MIARLTNPSLFAEGMPCVLPKACEGEGQDADEDREPNSRKSDHEC